MLEPSPEALLYTFADVVCKSTVWIRSHCLNPGMQDQWGRNCYKLVTEVV